MESIKSGFINALKLIFSFNYDVYQIILLSLFVSLFATIIGGILGLLFGIKLGINTFRLKNFLVKLIYVLMGVPPVVVGLIVYLLLSRKGTFGFLKLIYKPTAMIIAQSILVFPIVAGNIYNSTRKKGLKIINLGKVLGANKNQQKVLLIKEMQSEIISAFISGYGRAISEVGAVMVVGGNIERHTRVMTTSITMLHSMGQYDKAIAMGIVLLSLSFIFQSLLFKLQRLEA